MVDTLTRVEDSGRRPSLDEARRGNLILRRTLGDSATFGWVTEIVVTSDLVVTADLEMPPHLKFLDRATGEVVAEFGPNGEGPGEFVDIRTIIVNDPPAPTISVFDFQNRRISEVRLPTGDSGPQLVGETAFRTDAYIWQLVAATGSYVANGIFFGRYTLARLDSAGGVLRRWHGDPPYQPSEVPNRSALAALNQNHLTGLPGGETVAVAYQHANRVDLFNLDAGRHRTLAGPRPVETHFEFRQGSFGFIRRRDERAYVDLASTKSYLYGLFCGCTHPRTPGRYPLATKLHVWRWDGTFVAELEFDRPVSKLAVSSTGDRVWALYATPIPYIGEWELPGWLRTN